VLKEAVEKNCNLIIAHEPTFYNHTDETSSFENDPVYLEKQAFIRQHRLIIWRFHDHWHRHTPDGIYVGMLDKLGWKDKTIHGNPQLIKIEEQTLSKLTDYLHYIFPADGIRVIGDPDMNVSKIGLTVGASGAALAFKLLRDDTDVLIGGELNEWEIYQYVNDATLQKRKKALIILGHINSEEAGMDYFATWLRGLNPGVPVHFVANKIPYWSPSQQ
jgi:putative NIF3 family GTP cyclohydrolase 1 type 2